MSLAPSWGKGSASPRTGSPALSRVLLKARPTAAQLADRLGSPLLEGLELYLDVQDIQDDGWLERILDLVASHDVPDDFAWVVEGPLRSLDGAYFDLARESEADREVMARIVQCAARLEAEAVVIHCIAPVRDDGILTSDNRTRALRTAERVLAHYTKLCLSSNLVPTIENIPPILRMREQAFVFSLIGMSAADLVWLTDRCPGLRVTCDVSHAQLYLNAMLAEESATPEQMARAVAFVKEHGQERSLREYMDALTGRVLESHLSNAEGLLGEGLPYDQGVIDLDAAVASLLPTTRFIVTEPIEPDANKGTLMREMARRIFAVRNGLDKGA